MDEVGRDECIVNEGDYIIIGFPKCGTSSLYQYLTNKHPDKKIHRRELIWRDDGVEEFERRYNGCTPVIITRDPVYRILSAYNYYEWLKGTDLIEWINNKKPINQIGTNSPIEASKYENFIKRFTHLNPIIYKLEDMIDDSDFKKTNNNEYQVSNDIIRMIRERLND